VQQTKSCWRQLHRSKKLTTAVQSRLFSKVPCGPIVLPQSGRLATSPLSLYPMHRGKRSAGASSRQMRLADTGGRGFSRIFT
jgi:hypothetical protein